jgi:hypothetical protein
MLFLREPQVDGPGSLRRAATAGPDASDNGPCKNMAEDSSSGVQHEAARLELLLNTMDNQCHLIIALSAAALTACSSDPSALLGPVLTASGPARSLYSSALGPTWSEDGAAVLSYLMGPDMLGDMLTTVLGMPAPTASQGTGAGEQHSSVHDSTPQPHPYNNTVPTSRRWSRLLSPHYVTSQSMGPRASVSVPPSSVPTPSCEDHPTCCAHDEGSGSPSASSAPGSHDGASGSHEVAGELQRAPAGPQPSNTPGDLHSPLLRSRRDQGLPGQAPGAEVLVQPSGAVLPCDAVQPPGSALQAGSTTSNSHIQGSSPPMSGSQQGSVHGAQQYIPPATSNTAPLGGNTSGGLGPKRQSCHDMQAVGVIDGSGSGYHAQSTTHVRLTPCAQQPAVPAAVLDGTGGSPPAPAVPLPQPQQYTPARWTQCHGSGATGHAAAGETTHSRDSVFQTPSVERCC